MKNFSVIFISCFIFSYLQAQPYPQNYFRDPLKIPIELAADFGELRFNHYHMGLDIRTQQRENLPVVAAADGYVSHISISPGGYGNMMLVTHPNGYTTLYAHLNMFYDKLAAYIKEKQYRDKQWEQEFDLPPNLFPVTKGQFIALSGNTGGSQGPHLHFEIRDTKTGKHQNPMFFGLDIPDNIPPIIFELFWYDRRYSTYQSGPRSIKVSGGNGSYITTPQVIKVGSPIISLGIRAEDKTSNSPFLFGIYKSTIRVDGVEKFSFALNNFTNAESRYVNAGIDYKRKMSGGSYLQHLCRLPGNKLNIFSGDDGIITLTDENAHDVEVTAEDATGHISTVKFAIQFDPALQTDLPVDNAAVAVQPLKPGRIYSPNADFIYSANAFYDIVPFKMSEQPSGNALQVSPTIQLSSYTIPIHDYYTVSIACNDPQNKDKDKVVMQLTSGTATTVIKGLWKGSRMEGKFNRLGNVRLLVDEQPPVISPTGWGESAVVYANKKTLSVRCSDNLGALQNFWATLNGEWVLFSLAGNTYTYNIDERLKEGQNSLVIHIEDVAGNVTEKTYSVTRSFANSKQPTASKTAAKKSIKNGSKTKGRK